MKSNSFIKEHSIDIDKVLKDYPLKNVVRKKRERHVYESKNDYFVKIWVPNWTQSKITHAGFDLGFYDKDLCPVFHKFIVDSSGHRGYILKRGNDLIVKNKNDWTHLNKKTTLEQRKTFIMRFLKNSINARGIFCDMFPSNIVLFEKKISLIDLDAFRSFSFLFDKNKSYYEEFDINAWWKPHETSMRDLNITINSYLKDCLDMNIDVKIESVDSIVDLIKIIK